LCSGFASELQRQIFALLIQQANRQWNMERAFFCLAWGGWAALFYI
jgi:hypothetical protein